MIVPALIVGYGNMGTKHARVIRELQGANAIFGVVDPTPERRKRAELDVPGCATFASLPEALAARPEKIYATIAASTPLHYQLVQACIEAGVPTLVEKPIASTATEGAKLVELAKKKNVLLTVGHVERFNPAVVAARRMVTDSVIGKVIQLSFRRVGGSPDVRLNLQDVLVDLAVHDYDLARFITGEELEIVDALGHSEAGALDSAFVLARLSNGASMQLQVNWRTPVKVRRIELTGTLGYIEVNLITQQVVLYRQNPLLASPINPDSTSYFDSYLASFATPDRIELGIDRREPLREEIKAFLQAIDGAPVVMSPEDAVAAVKLTEATRKRLPQLERASKAS